jgi:zinc protease
MFVLVKPSPSTPVAAADIWVGTGSYCERDSEWGVSHFLEHMFFKGTTRRGVGEIDREVGSLGGYINAGTSYDFTHYYICLPGGRITSALDILADALFHSVFNPEEIDKERAVVVEEISRNEDSPVMSMYDRFLTMSFNQTGYGHPILGNRKSLAQLGREELLDYIQRRYAPSNCGLMVVGDVDPDRIFDEVERLFQEPGREINPVGACAAPVAPVETHAVMTHPDITQSYLLAGFTLPDLAAKGDLHAMELLAAIVGEGRSSRLHARLTEDLGLCANIHAYHYDLMHLGLFYVDATYESASHGRVQEEIAIQMDRVLQQQPEDRELEKAKKMVLSSFAFMNERASALAHTFGHYHMLSSIDDAVAYCDRIMAVQPSDILRVAQTYLVQDNHRQLYLEPERGV